jgi:pantoate--beta-alanine ligase
MSSLRLDIVRTVPELRARVAAWRQAGHPVGLVPTMGAIHEGHLTLVRAGLAAGERVVVSIFVNPRQFAPSEDFDRYPRREAADAALLAEGGAHLLFAPTPEAMYPAGFATTVSVGGSLTAGLCAPVRPGHFDGVATVVTKLLLQCGPDRAYFGEKDYQQLQVVRRLVADLDLPLTVVPVPTVREPDGLALSSRNAYLSPEERRRAAVLPQALADIAVRFAAGEPASALLDEGRRHLEEAGFGPVDYLSINDAESLEPLASPGRAARVIAAAWLGRTRLIDNWPVPG